MTQKNKVCPAGDCSGGTGSRQKNMSNGMLEKLPETQKEVVGKPKRCSYCGCVYDGVTKQVFGFYDNYNLGQGWKPHRSILEI
jgi:hypothetical protein